MSSDRRCLYWAYCSSYLSNSSVCRRCRNSPSSVHLSFHRIWVFLCYLWDKHQTNTWYHSQSSDSRLWSIPSRELHPTQYPTSRYRWPKARSHPWRKYTYQQWWQPWTSTYSCLSLVARATASAGSNKLHTFSMCYTNESRWRRCSCCRWPPDNDLLAGSTCWATALKFSHAVHKHG